MKFTRILPFLCGLVLWLQSILPAAPIKQADLREFDIPKEGVKFLIPKSFSISEENGKFTFSHPNGTVHFTFQKMPYASNGGNYDSAKELVNYVSGQMKQHFSAYDVDIRTCRFSQLDGYQLSMDWAMSGTTIRQYEVSLETTDGILSFGSVGTPAGVDGNLQHFASLLNSVSLQRIVATESPAEPITGLPFQLNLGKEWQYHLSDGTHVWTDMETRDPPSLLFYIPLDEADIAGRSIETITQTARDKAETKENYSNVTKLLPLECGSIQAWHYAANVNEHSEKPRLELTVILPLGSKGALFQFNFPDEQYSYVDEILSAFQNSFKPIDGPPSADPETSSFPRKLRPLRIGLDLAGFEGSVAVIDMDGRLVIALPLQTDQPVYELMLKSGSLFAMAHELSQNGTLRVLGILNHKPVAGIEGGIARVHDFIRSDNSSGLENVITILDAQQLK